MDFGSGDLVPPAATSIKYSMVGASVDLKAVAIPLVREMVFQRIQAIHTTAIIGSEVLESVAL